MAYPLNPRGTGAGCALADAACETGCEAVLVAPGEAAQLRLPAGADAVTGTA